MITVTSTSAGLAGGSVAVAAGLLGKAAGLDLDSMDGLYRHDDVPVAFADGESRQSAGS